MLMAQVMSAGLTNKRPVIYNRVVFDNMRTEDPPHRNINFSFRRREQNSELLISELNICGSVHHA